MAADGSGLVCDNKAALYTFSKESKRVPAGQANTDIQRVLRLRPGQGAPTSISMLRRIRTSTPTTRTWNLRRS